LVSKLKETGFGLSLRTGCAYKYSTIVTDNRYNYSKVAMLQMLQPANIQRLKTGDEEAKLMR